jgi:hypothetical protein
MAKLTMAARRALPKSDFAVPSKAPGPGSYPMPDQAHANVAKGLAGMHGGPKGAVAKKAKQKGFKKGGPVRGQGGMGVKFNPALMS